MPILIINGLHIVCDTCGISAPAAFDQTTAINNAIAAGFVSFIVPPLTPRAGQIIYIDSICLAGAATAAAAAAANQSSSPSPPASPTNLAVVAQTATQINLSWTNNDPNQTSVYIERSTDGYNFTQIGSTSSTASIFSDTSLIPQTIYYYRIRIISPIGYSNYTSIENTITLALPNAPNNLTVTAISATQINLSWTDNDSSQTAIYIERSLDGVSFEPIFTTTAIATTFSDTGLNASTKYYYQIKAFSPTGFSNYTAMVNAVTLSA